MTCHCPLEPLSLHDKVCKAFSGSEVPFSRLVSYRNQQCNNIHKMIWKKSSAYSIQEEQRRVSNREMCRDELLGLLRDASSLKQSFSAAKQPAASQEGHHRLPCHTNSVICLPLPLSGFLNSKMSHHDADEAAPE